MSITAFKKAFKTGRNETHYKTTVTIRKVISENVWSALVDAVDDSGQIAQISQQVQDTLDAAIFVDAGMRVKNSINRKLGLYAFTKRNSQ